MKVAHLRALLDEMAKRATEDGDGSLARSLRSLAKVLDGHDDLDVAKFVRQIRQVRGL